MEDVGVLIATDRNLIGTNEGDILRVGRHTRGTSLGGTPRQQKMPPTQSHVSPSALVYKGKGSQIEDGEGHLCSVSRTLPHLLSLHCSLEHEPFFERKSAKIEVRGASRTSAAFPRCELSEARVAPAPTPRWRLILQSVATKAPASSILALFVPIRSYQIHLASNQAHMQLASRSSQFTI
jgi:hypothetical protein